MILSIWPGAFEIAFEALFSTDYLMLKKKISTHVRVISNSLKMFIKSRDKAITFTEDFLSEERRIKDQKDELWIRTTFT